MPDTPEQIADAALDGWDHDPGAAAFAALKVTIVTALRRYGDQRAAEERQRCQGWLDHLRAAIDRLPTSLSPE